MTEAVSLEPSPTVNTIRLSRPINNRPFVPVLVIVEGIHDVDFLRKLTCQLHRQDATIPDLQDLEQSGLVIFVPFGGGQVLPWARRFAPLGCPEFHLYDREDEPETRVRKQVVDLINERTDCRALLLDKRSLESYLHPAAIFDAGGGEICLASDEDMATCLARTWFMNRTRNCQWEEVPANARRRLTTQAKRWLNTAAVPHMTLGLLRLTDPSGALLAWLRGIGSAVDDF